MIMSFYSTQEMACISFNKLRIEYYASEKKPWAVWLHKLLENPTQLFSTTLIGVNVSLMASSECARRLYEALGYNPNLAPITHIPFVLLFGELIPMFAARIYAEHMAKLGIPFLYISAVCLSPFSRVVDIFFRYISTILGGSQAKETTAFLTREEIQKLIEESELPKTAPADKHVNDIVANIFSLKSKRAYQLMEKLIQIPCVSARTTVGQLKEVFLSSDCTYIPVYHRSEQKIVGIIRPQDLLDASNSKRVYEYVQDVTVVSENTTGFELFKHLQKQNLPIALVLNQAGIPAGVITIDDILEELFFQEEPAENLHTPIYLEKSFSADTAIQDFNEAYGLHIDPQGCRTFAELIEQILGRNPAVDDKLYIEPIEIVVKETTLFKAKTILIRTQPV